MDEQLVLTAHTLRLNPNLQRAGTDEPVFVVKNVPARRYLTLTAEQWNLLRNFSNPATVPDVLRAVILNRTCLPLHEFYELVLKAQRAGILQTDRQSDPEVRARRWLVPLPPLFFVLLGGVSAIAAIALIITHPFPWPHPWPEGFKEVAITWAILVGALSLGRACAASALRFGGGEVYSPVFNLLRPIPYFSVNLDDACMTRRLTQAGVWCGLLTPVSLVAAFAMWSRPSYATLPVLTLLLMLRPFAGGAIPELLSFLCRGRVLDTQRNFLFSQNQRWKVKLRFGLSRVSAFYVIARLVWGFAWIALLMHLFLRLAVQNEAEFLTSWAYWRQVLGFFGAMAGVAVIGYLGLPLLRGLRAWSAHWTKATERAWQRWRVAPNEPIAEEQISRVFAESLLLRRLAPAERGEMARKGVPRTIKAWTTFFHFNDRADHVGIIISGKVAVYRRMKSGRPDEALVLREGDIFGAHALLDPERQQVQLRSLTPVVALMIPIEEFQKRVITPVGVASTNDLAQKMPFLRNLDLCSNWHPQAIARFAQLASVASYDMGEVIIADRQDSQQFYVVYEGRVWVKRKNRVLARLRAGAFFGEVSLLQNSAAVSDVIAREPTRCLTISKADFLRFLTHNPLVGLQLEAISSERLGRAIFPLSARSFDIR